MQKLKDILDDIGSDKLRDSDTLAEPEKFSKSGKIEENLGDFKVTLGITGEASVSLINSSHENEQANDPEGVFLAPSYSGQSKKKLNELLDPHPVIPLPKDSAYLRYALGVNFTGGADADFDAVGLAIKSKLSWQASYYSKHSFKKGGSDKTIKDAFLDDLGFNGDQPTPMDNIKSLFSKTGFKEAKVGDILTFSSAGSLSAAVEIDATELLTGSIAASGLFNKVIPITYSAGFKANLSSSFSGDFFMAVAVKSANKLEIVVRRATNRLSDANVNFGAQAKIDLSSATTVVSAYLKGLASTSEAAMKKLEDKVDKLLTSALENADFTEFFDTLSANEAKILKKWYDTLIGKVEGEIDELIEKKLKTILEPLQKLNKILKEWAKEVENYSEVSMSIALTYEMSKLESTGDLLRFECDTSVFHKYRSDLLLYSFDSITKAAQDPKNTKVKIKRFLNATTIEKKTGSSLILKLGGWSFGGGRKLEKVWVDLIDRSDVDNPFVKYASYLGSREFDSVIFKDKLKYGFTVEGTFKEDGVGSMKDPDISELSFTLAASASYRENKITEHDLRILFDFGLISGTLDRSGKFDSAKDISLDKINGLKRNKPADINLGISVTGRGAKAMIAYLASASKEDQAKALSLAMYRWDNMPGREKLSERLNGYSEVWSHVIQTSKDQDWSTKIILNQALDKHAFDALHIEENEHWSKQNEVGNYRRSLHGLITANEIRFSKVFKPFKAGLVELDKQINSSTYDSYRNLDGLFDEIRTPWVREFSGRWILALMHIGAQKILSENKEVLETDIQYSFEIKQGKTTIPITAEALQ